MSALSTRAAMRLELEDSPNWTRPRRQTNPDLVHRPSGLLRQATRRSADVTGLQNNYSHSNSSSPLADQRPRTSGSITHTSAASSSATATPTKRTSTSSHRSSLSVSALSNPALAEIPSRKYNALRLSTDGYAENYRQHHNNNNLGGEPCAAPRDPAATNAPAPAPATSNSIASPNSTYSSSYFQQTSSPVSPSSASSSTTKRPSTASRLSAATGQSSPGTSNDRLFRPTPKQATTPQTARSNNGQDSPSIDAVLKNKSILKKVVSSTDMASSPSRRRRESTPLSPRSAATASNMNSVAVDEQYQSSSAYDESNLDEQKDYSTDDTRRSDDVFLNIAKSSVNSRRNSLDRRRVS